MDENRKITIEPGRISRSVDANIKVENNRLVIDWSADPAFSPRSLLVLEANEAVIWERPLTDAEISARRLAEDFGVFVRSRWANLDYSFRVAFRCGDGDWDDCEIVTIENSRKEIRGKGRRSGDKRDLIYEPVRLRDVAMETGAVYPEVVVMPFHKEEEGQFGIRLSEPALMMIKFIQCVTRKVKYSGSRFITEVTMPKLEEPVGRVLLVSRRGGAEYPMEYTLQEEGGRVLVRASIDLETIELVDPFWYVSVETTMFGSPVWIQPIVSRKLEKRMKLYPFHGKMKDDHIFVARPLKTRICQLMIRKREFFDSPMVRVKEILAMAVAGLFGSRYKGKGYWLVFEKFCAAAQDNGYAFFKFCMEQLSREQNKHIYYVIDKRSAAYDEVKKYSKNIVGFMSFRHMLYSLVADMYVASESKAHLYAWRGKPSLIYGRIRRKPIFFLQHGVLALKRVEKIFGRSGTDAMDYIVTTSRHEQDIVVNNHGYRREEAPILGLARWDRLVDESADADRTILVMPTWRKWIQDSGGEAFVQSDYFRRYSGLLHNEKLISALEEHDIKLLLYMHPKFKEYMGEVMENLRIDSDRCRLISFGEEPLNELIRTSKMIITDYSSVCWDFFYLGKPCVFYQFDYDLYMENHGSYIDMTKDLWGDRYLEEDELVDGILEYIGNGFTEKPQFAAMRGELFEYLDHDNSRRTYEFVKAIK